MVMVRVIESFICVCEKRQRKIFVGSVAVHSLPRACTARPKL